MNTYTACRAEAKKLAQSQGRPAYITYRRGYCDRRGINRGFTVTMLPPGEVGQIVAATFHIDNGKLHSWTAPWLTYELRIGQ